MGTQIFLGNPPANVQQWIKNHYGPKCDALCFTAKYNNSTIQLTKLGSPDGINLQTSTNGSSWTPYNVEDVITVPNAGGKVYFKAVGSNGSLASGDSNFHYFVTSGEFEASGNINSLLEEDEETARTMSLEGKEFCYVYLFSGTSLTQAPELPATTLANYCYEHMFEGCTSLTRAPELPATTLANSCYNSMFYDCTNLNTITLGYTDNFADAPSEAFGRWVSGVAPTGTFYYNGNDRTTGESAIPTGWTVSKWQR